MKVTIKDYYKEVGEFTIKIETPGFTSFQSVNAVVLLAMIGVRAGTVWLWELPGRVYEVASVQV